MYMKEYGTRSIGGNIMQVKVKEQIEEIGSCGCGRSPIGKCIGWHGLTEEDYQNALAKYEEKLFEEENKK